MLIHYVTECTGTCNCFGGFHLFLVYIAMYSVTDTLYDDQPEQTVETVLFNTKR